VFFNSFKITGIAVGQIFLLAVLGYLLLKRKFLNADGLDALSRLTMDVTLPILIFCQLMKDFSFMRYPNWWALPLISLSVTGLGLGVGFLFLKVVKGQQQKLQFLSLVGFQNSGYLPLALVASLLSGDNLSVIFIYIFLFLTGFNLCLFSLGVYILNYSKEVKFRWQSLFSMPVIATLVSLIVIFIGLNKFIPEMVFKPLRMLGDTTLPLAMLVVGGNLAQFNLGQIDKKPMALLILSKMIILPLLGLGLIFIFNVPALISLLLLIQLSMPSAVTLSVILSTYKKEDFLVSQGILLTHIVSVFTIPLFLIIYFSRFMLK